MLFGLASRRGRLPLGFGPRYRFAGGKVNASERVWWNSGRSMQNSSAQDLTNGAREEPSCNGHYGRQGGPGGSRVVDVALAALFRRLPGGQVEVLVARRHAHAIRGGLWEFPGGKIEPGEDAAAAALREVEEEVGVPRGCLVSDPVELTIVEHSDSDVLREQSIRLHAYLAEVKPEAMPQALGASEVRWIGVERLGEFQWPKANEPINRALLARLT